MENRLGYSLSYLFNPPNPLIYKPMASRYNMVDYDSDEDLGINQLGPLSMTFFQQLISFVVQLLEMENIGFML